MGIRTTSPANGQHLAVHSAGRSREVYVVRFAGNGTEKGDGGMDGRVIL
jgi:hypothetical protein